MNIFFKIRITLLVVIFSGNILYAQQSLTEKKWTSFANNMPEDWYGSEESKQIAENVLLYQRNIGGWPKNTAFHQPLTESDRAKILKDKDINDAIFDNSATTTEIRFLATMYQKTAKEPYKDAVLRGLHFILKAQYKNGGWPMFYPLKKGYYTHITFNDDAITRLMLLLRDIQSQKSQFSFITDEKVLSEVKNSWERGLQCILKTQIVVNGKPTVWCAQHDENTFLPAKARAYELPSFSGNESAGLLELLMGINNPSPEIIRAVQGGIDWFETHKVKNIKIESFKNTDGKTDIHVVKVEGTNDLWARFYDLETGQPYFCDRDGIKKSRLEDIGYERRNGYSWFTDKPKKLLDKYPDWKAKWIK